MHKDLKSGRGETSELRRGCSFTTLKVIVKMSRGHDCNPRHVRQKDGEFEGSLGNILAYATL